MANGNGKKNGAGGKRKGKSNGNGKREQRPICGRRCKNCQNPKCRHRYAKEEYALWACPECGRDRHCQETKLYSNGACHKHGGPTPSGIFSPHITNGRRSKFLPFTPDDNFKDLLHYVGSPEVDCYDSDQELELINPRLLRHSQIGGHTVHIYSLPPPCP